MLRQDGNKIVWAYDGEILQVEPWGVGSVRVRAVKMQKIGCAPDWALLPPAPCAVQIAETEFEGLRALCMENEKLRAYVQENGRVTIQNTAGRTLVQEFVRDRTVRGTNFSDADLEKASLSGCDLTETVFRNAKLKGCDLRGAKWARTDIRFAKLGDTAVDLDGAVYLAHCLGAVVK